MLSVCQLTTLVTRRINLVGGRRVLVDVIGFRFSVFEFGWRSQITFPNFIYSKRSRLQGIHTVFMVVIKPKQDGSESQGITHSDTRSHLGPLTDNSEQKPEHLEETYMKNPRKSIQ